MSVVFVVLVLAVWALLHKQTAAAVARRDDDTMAAPEALPNISRGAAVQRSSFHAPRAPGLLCERAFALYPVVYARAARALRSVVSFAQARHFTRIAAARA